jgi:hypothetical protein
VSRSCAVGLAALLLAGCTHVVAASPYGHEVHLLGRDDATSVRRQWRAWFALWGIVRLAGKDPADVVRDEALCEVRVRIEDNVPDAIIGLIYTMAEPIGIVPQTVIVEGNRGDCR